MPKRSDINHEYWHLRENDPGQPQPAPDHGASRVDIKFNFGNCVYGGNEIKAVPPYGYVPEIAFRNMNWMDHLAGSRFPALAGWQKSPGEIFEVLNQVAHRIFSQFQNNGTPVRPENEIWQGQGGKGFGYGTVHHAIGTLRMRHRWTCDGSIEPHSVVDEDLRAAGAGNLHVCDMSVMPFSSAANPVRTLVAPAPRLIAPGGAGEKWRPAGFRRAVSVR